MKLVTVFGGTGFLGRHIVDRLTAAAVGVRIAARHPARPSAGRAGGAVETVAADIRDPRSVEAAVACADGVVNAVSAYVEKAGVTYAAVHERGAAHLAEACARGGARLVHVSGIGADPASASRYIAARGRGEAAVRQALPSAVILRPSVMFGPDDAFLNTLAGIARVSPVVPLIAGGRTRLQPVHVEDVAEAARLTLEDPATGGGIYELGGPEVVSLAGIVEMILARMGRRRLRLPIPLELAEPVARLAELLPAPPLSTGQVDLLKQDNVAGGALPGLADLGIAPRRLEETIAGLAARW